jgi:hypothetical protein
MRDAPEEDDRLLTPFPYTGQQGIEGFNSAFGTGTGNWFETDSLAAMKHRRLSFANVCGFSPRGDPPLAGRSNLWYVLG